MRLELGIEKQLSAYEVDLMKINPISIVCKEASDDLADAIYTNRRRGEWVRIVMKAYLFTPESEEPE